MKSPSHSVHLFALLALTLTGRGQQVPSTAMRPLAFLSGRWVNESPAQVQEESWLPINGNSMIGSFRVVQGGRAVFYEFWAVELDNNLPVLKLKHFNPNLAGWEEKDVSTTLPLVSSAADDAVFRAPDGSVALHYQRAGDKLTCTVHHVHGGKAGDETFTLQKASDH